jgi:hypothetical protein
MLKAKIFENQIILKSLGAREVNLAQTSVTLADLAVLFRPFDLLAPKDINIIWLPSSLLIMFA